VGQLDALVSEILSRERLAPLVEKHKLYPELREKVPMIGLVGIARANVVVAPADSVVPKKRGTPASVFTISFRDRNPRIAAEVANDLATLFTAAAGKATGDAARTTADFMRAERDRSERELRAQERLVSAFKEKYRGELPTELGTNTSKLERLALQRQTLATQLDAAETRLADLEKLGDLARFYWNTGEERVPPGSLRLVPTGAAVQTGSMQPPLTHGEKYKREIREVGTGRFRVRR